MSIDINWACLDATLGHSLKNLLNTQLHDVLELPDFLQSVTILKFDLGTIAPEITIQAISDPFEEFYEDAEEEEEPDLSTADSEPHSLSASRRQSLGNPHLADGNTSAHMLDAMETASVTSNPPPYAEHLTHRTSASSSGWEGMNVPYFHSAFATPNGGIVSASGLSTPQPRFMSWNGFQPHLTTPRLNVSAHDQLTDSRRRRRSSSHQVNKSGLAEANQSRRGSPDDTQLESKVKYTGNITIALQAHLALNYPSSAFVTLPIEMHVSEFQIDAVAVIAYIEKQIHVSLMSDENPIKGMKISSLIGEQGKMSLTDVDRLEKFIVKEIRDVVEREFVFPSYYTFLL